MRGAEGARVSSLLLNSLLLFPACFILTPTNGRRAGLKSLPQRVRGFQVRTLKKKKKKAEQQHESDLVMQASPTHTHTRPGRGFLFSVIPPTSGDLLLCAAEKQ